METTSETPSTRAVTTGSCGPRKDHHSPSHKDQVVSCPFTPPYLACPYLIVHCSCIGPSVLLPFNSDFGTRTTTRLDQNWTRGEPVLALSSSPAKGSQVPTQADERGTGVGYNVPQADTGFRIRDIWCYLHWRVGRLASECREGCRSC